MAAKSPAAVAISASAMPGPTVARFVEPVRPMRWNVIRIPHTVPNRPMNGATLAIVARNGTRFSSLFTSTAAARSSARSTAARLLRIGRGAASPGLAACAGDPELRVQLRVASLKHADERTGRQRRADRLHFGELRAAAKDVEKRRRLSPDGPIRQRLLKDDRPRNNRQQNQDCENDEVDGPRLAQDVGYIDIPDRGSALLHL